jgi:peptidyl-prolyl cis-trans isomerase SurA
MWMSGQMNRFQTLALAAGLALVGLIAAPAPAQNLFSTVVSVNDTVVTEFEVDQRQQFLRLLGAPGSSRNEVIDILIDDRLKEQAIRSAGLEVTDEEILAGMTEFASRANLTSEAMIAQFEQNGVAAETFRAFVSVGIGWRNLVQARFGARVQVSEQEIDRALGRSGEASSIRVLVSEIIIPAPQDRLAEVQEVAQQIAASTSEAEFSEFARQYSATATRDSGGRLPWQNLNDLPPVLRPILLGLAPGEVSEPLNIPDAVALFQLRGIEETGAPAPQFAAIDYAAYYLPGGRSEAALAQAAKLRREIDVCDDLYGIAQGLPAEVLERGSKPPAEIPQDMAFELSKLDPGEVSTALTRNDGQTLVFLMLCGRTAAVNEDVERGDAAAALRQNRVTAYADGYLEQLRADARIVTQ